MAKPLPKVSGLLKANAFLSVQAEDSGSLPELPVAKAVDTSNEEQLQPIFSKTLSGDASDSTELFIQPSSLPDKESSGLLTIPLSKLKIHPFNSRSIRTQDRIEEVRDMLQDSMQREPVTVVPGRTDEDRGYFYILSGQTRFHAANLAGWTEMRAQINNLIDPDDHLAFFAASIEHNASEKETDYDLAIKVHQLAASGHEMKEIQKAIRQTERGLRRLLSITNLPEPVLRVVKENPAKLSAAFCEILKSASEKLDEETLVKITRTVAEENLAQRDLQRAVDVELRRKEIAKSKITRAKRQYTRPILNQANQHAGEIKVMNSRKNGNLLISLSADLPEDEAKTLQEKIEAAITEVRG